MVFLVVALTVYLSLSSRTGVLRMCCFEPIVVEGSAPEGKH